MAAVATELQEPGTAPAPTRRRSARSELSLAPGVELGILPTRAAKALAAAGLHELGIAARYIITDPHAGGAPFTVVTADFEPVEHITAGRAFIRGLLFAMQPPAPLAAEVSIARNEWAALQGMGGRCVAGLTFCCGAAGCIVTASVRQADQGKAWAQLVALGWATSPTADYLCPDCACLYSHGQQQQ